MDLRSYFCIIPATQVQCFSKNQVIYTKYKTRGFRKEHIEIKVTQRKVNEDEISAYKP